MDPTEQLPHLTSHQHCVAARELLGQVPQFALTTLHCRLAAAQIHATLAVYQGLYELLGDCSAIDDAARRLR